MIGIKKYAIVFVWVMACAGNTFSQKDKVSLTHEVSVTISKKYLNLPVSYDENRSKMSFETDGQPALNVVMRLASSKPDYWVFYDVSHLKGKVLKLKYELLF